MRILAVDLGDVRTGVAVSDPSGTRATPVTVITERDTGALADKIARLCAEHQAGLVVVGYPKNMDGSAGSRAEKCAAAARLISEASSLPHILWDERCTTLSAIGYLNAADVRGKKRKSVIDAAAASIILQDYLDSRRNANQG